MIDADFGAEPGMRHSMEPSGASEDEFGEGGMIPSERSHGAFQDAGEMDSGIGNARTGQSFSFSKILLIIYIGGVIYFFTRFVNHSNSKIR